jgi:3-dehydroquinate synthase/2-deoxy-scyllo-inosose synthase
MSTSEAAMRGVVFGDRTVPYLFGDADDFARAAADLGPDRWCVVSTDQPWLAAVTERVERALGGVAPVTHIRIPDGERAKTLDTVGTVCSQLVAAGASRASVLVAVGGGNVSNIAGLCAALMFRGIRLVHVPTSLIGMSDVVLSLKQGVSIAGVKNGLGTYYAPELIWADPGVLDSLPATEIRAGLAEIVKNALIIDPAQIPVLTGLLRPDARYGRADLTTLIELAIAAKSRVLADDPTERHGALVLEYGHTVGHALEVLSGGTLGHGLGVALGMRVAARVAHRLGLLAEEHVEAHDRLMAAAGLPMTPPAALLAAATDEALTGQLARDNKRGYLRLGADEVPMVLLTGLGVPAGTAELPIVGVPLEHVLAAFRETFQASVLTAAML